MDARSAGAADLRGRGRNYMGCGAFQRHDTSNAPQEDMGNYDALCIEGLSFNLNETELKP